VQLAALETAASRRAANVVERFVRQQRLVAGYQIDLGEIVLEVSAELAERDFQ
jgi:hypothetical protein